MTDTSIYGRIQCRWLFGLAVLAAAVVASPAGAQIRSSFPSSGKSVGGLSSVGGGDDTSDPATVTSQFTTATKDRPAVLMITVQIAPGWHVYSITQPPGGPQRAKIDVTPSPQYRLLGEFNAFPAPTKHIDQVAWVGLEMQEHENQVTWYAPIELAAGVDPASVEIRGNVKLQVCKESCVPVNTQFTARLGMGVPIGQIAARGLGTGDSELAKDINISPKGAYQAEGSEVKWTGRIEPASAQSGGSSNLILTATPATGWHIYAWADRDDGHGSKPTLITLQPLPGLTGGSPATDAAINTDNSVPEFGAMRFHEGSVTWKIPLAVSADAKAGRYEVSGILGYQSCETRGDNMGTCELPQGARFRGTLEVGGAATARVPLDFSPATYREAATAAATATTAGTQAAIAAAESLAGDSHAGGYDLGRIVVEQPHGSLGYYMLLAFVGGIILNLMPCVLPVIGLKVMSFVQQAGHSRSHALALNAWYSAGIVSVFLLLGFLAATIGLSWGGQFGSTAFNASLAAIVFAMALSLLGVWEVPIPGFFGGGAAQELAAKEGPLGAFLKGVITTVLATPCTGPFMATAIAWTVTQTMGTTLLVFGSLGLGMASPYLLVGVYPELLRFLPKPGAWMEVFKQVMGFVLLATVIFILSFIQPLAVVPTLLLLLGIGVACWFVARTPLTAEFGERAKSWGGAGAIVVAFALFAFGWLYPGTPVGANGMTNTATAGGPWQPFSLAALQRATVDQRRTVLVDFSAEWCLTCKTLEKAVLHTAAVQEAIANSGAVTMYADFTEYPPEIERTIRALGSNGVPVIAIFPASTPYEPIVFRGAYSRSELVSALERATGRQLGADKVPVAGAMATSNR